MSHLYIVNHYTESLSSIAISLGKHRDFFSHMKRNTPEMFSYLMEIGCGNIETGMKKYCSESLMLKKDTTRMYYELLENRSISRFYRDIKKHIRYKNKHSFMSSLRHNVTFTHDDGKFMPFDTFCEYKKIIKIYKTWMEKNFTPIQKQKIKQMYEY